MIEFSIVIPVYNEKDNVIPLNTELQDLIQQIKQPCEIIWVDDGSTDGSLEMIKDLAKTDPAKTDPGCRYFGFEKKLRAVGCFICRVSGGKGPVCHYHGQ